MSVSPNLNDAPSAEADGVERRFARLLADAMVTPSGLEIVSTAIELGELLVSKNRAYGDSALDPVRICSTSSPIEQILVRIDDKLSRLKRGHAGGEDVEKDLLGYSLLLRIARLRAEREMTRALGRVAIQKA